MNYYSKYLKYKHKYNELKKSIGSGPPKKTNEEMMVDLNKSLTEARNKRANLSRSSFTVNDPKYESKLKARKKEIDTNEKLIEKIKSDIEKLEKQMNK